MQDDVMCPLMLCFRFCSCRQRVSLTDWFGVKRVGFALFRCSLSYTNFVITLYRMLLENGQLT